MYYIFVISQTQSPKTKEFFIKSRVMRIEGLFSPFEIPAFKELFEGSRYTNSYKKTDKKDDKGHPIMEVDVPGIQLFYSPTWEGSVDTLIANNFYTKEDKKISETEVEKSGTQLAKEILAKKDLVPFTEQEEDKIVRYLLSTLPQNFLNNNVYTIQYSCPVQQTEEVINNDGQKESKTSVSVELAQIMVKMCYMPKDIPEIEEKQRRSYEKEQYSLLTSGEKNSPNNYKYPMGLLNVWKEEKEEDKEAVPLSNCALLKVIRERYYKSLFMSLYCQ